MGLCNLSSAFTLCRLFSLAGILAVGFQSSGMSFQHVEHWFLWQIETWVGRCEPCCWWGRKIKPKRSGWCFRCLKDTSRRLPGGNIAGQLVRVPTPEDPSSGVFIHFTHSLFYTFSTYLIAHKPNLCLHTRDGIFRYPKLERHSWWNTVSVLCYSW